MRCGPILLIALGAIPLQAQDLNLRVVEDSTRRPLEGVVVRVLRDGRAIGTGLTSVAGVARFALPGAGRYLIRADRIGYLGVDRVPVDVSARGATSYVLVMPRVVRHLPELVVTTDTRCRRDLERGTLAAALWHEVQTALMAARVTADEGLEQIAYTRFVRDISARGALLGERVIEAGMTRGQPFGSLSPERLARHGYVFRDGDSVTYAAPDAALMLDESFVQSHCFTVREHPTDRRLAGLGFEPVAGRRQPDVRGTLWIDRPTSELRWLEFEYTPMPPPEGLGAPGGRVEFTRLQSGTWIVNAWHIRMPQVGEVQGPPGRVPPDQRYRLLGWVERGGNAHRPTRPPPTVSP